jgi:hypothetical protein
MPHAGKIFAANTYFPDLGVVVVKLTQMLEVIVGDVR